MWIVPGRRREKKVSIFKVNDIAKGSGQCRDCAVQQKVGVLEIIINYLFTGIFPPQAREKCLTVNK
jgi:hypothetical protein